MKYTKEIITELLKRYKNGETLKAIALTEKCTRENIRLMFNKFPDLKQEYFNSKKGSKVARVQRRLSALKKQCLNCRKDFYRKGLYCTYKCFIEYRKMMRGKRTELLCSCCKTVKPVTEFYPRRNFANSYHGYCKVCIRKNTKEWIKDHPELAKEMQRKAAKKYNASHLDKVREIHRRYRLANRDKFAVGNRRRSRKSYWNRKALMDLDLT